MEANAYKKKTGGVKSLDRDATWDVDCPYNDPTKFVNAIDHLFEREFLEAMFGPNNVIKKEDFLVSFAPGMFSSRVDLKYIFNLSKVRKKYQ